MITFIVFADCFCWRAIFFYSRVVEKDFSEWMPQGKLQLYTLKDDVDYVPMSWWRIFLIQFLNIAGLGPNFSAQ